MGNDKALEKSKIHKVYDLINNRKNAMLQALPKHVTADRLINIVTNVVRVNPKLADCSELSLIGAIMMSVYTGLEPSVLGHCYLVPYGKQVQFIIGYKGFLQLINNSGQVSMINAYVVRENDFFEYEYGLNEKLIHRPAKTDRGGLDQVYSIVTLKDGTKSFIVMNKEDVLEIKAFALKNKKNPKDKSLPWNAWEPEMWKKTILRRYSKALPLSIESQRLIAQDETVKTFDASFDNILSQPDEVDYKQIPEKSQYDQDIPEAEVIEDKTEAEKKQETELFNGEKNPDNDSKYHDNFRDLKLNDFPDLKKWGDFLEDLTKFKDKDGVRSVEDSAFTLGRAQTSWHKFENQK